MPYVVVYFIFNDFWSEVIVRFVVIGEIVDHHCLNILSINYRKHVCFF